VTFVHCGQTVGRIKTKLVRPMSIAVKRLHGTICHVPDDNVLDGDPAPPPRKRGGAPSPISGPCLLWPNGWMDQDGTWHGGGPWSRPHCARWGPGSPPQIWGQSPQFVQTTVLDGDPYPPPKWAEPPIFGPRQLWPNDCMFCMDQDATWYGGRPRPTRRCVRWGPSSPAHKGAQPPNCLPMSVVPNDWMD